MYVLLIEDEPMAREAMQRFLEQAGHSVCWAPCGLKGIQQMRFEKPDLVILDMLLTPEMSGWEVLRVKMSDPEIQGIPLIIQSGLDPEEIRRRGQVNVTSNIQIILSKPISPVDLLQAVEIIGTLRTLEKNPSDPFA
jgi:CheY-like chemotaxis protein